jgi:large subunit ribosomal protein L13
MPGVAYRVKVLRPVAAPLAGCDGLVKIPGRHAMIVGPKLTTTVGLRDEGKVRYSLAPLLSPIPCSAVHGGKPGIFEMKTFSAKPESVKRDWFVIDATNKTLGRLSTEVARRLRGKHKPEFTPHVDTGDYIVVINAGKVAVTGAKLDDKMYHRFTGYVGNLKTTSLKDLLATHPERVIEIAVKGMLPKNPLGRAMYRKLKVYGGADHPHTAQQPQALEI